MHRLGLNFLSCPYAAENQTTQHIVQYMAARYFTLRKELMTYIHWTKLQTMSFKNFQQPFDEVGFSITRRIETILK